ncbi:MAG: hypothetical protein LBI20_01130 [Holosporales bacterium]|nr:hypothetical protein [Holosporales bacterium]
MRFVIKAFYFHFFEKLYFGKLYMKIFKIFWDYYCFEKPIPICQDIFIRYVDLNYGAV